jgi:peroxiredoxin Q/BCP
MARPATKQNVKSKIKPAKKVTRTLKKITVTAKKKTRATAKTKEATKAVKGIRPKAKTPLPILRLFTLSGPKPIPKAAAAAADVKPDARRTARSFVTVGVGSTAPDFLMPATHLGQISSSALKGKACVLYFYPKDDTSGCTAQACEFRNMLPNFATIGATVIGVSKDSIESHQKFSQKYNLNFPLASDENNDVCESFGVWRQKSMYGRTYLGIERSTFVIDAKGIVRAIWRKVSVSGHAEEVRKAVEAL